MAMRFEVIQAASITVKEGKKPYKMATLLYRDSEGKPNEKKIMSFVNPDVFKIVENLKAGDVIYVEATKNDQGFWQWDKVTVSDEVAKSEPAASASSVKASYQEEQHAKNKSIIRQVALKAAVEHYPNVPVTMGEPSVLNIAETFEGWLNRD
jgi:hypothetical protein